MHVLLTVDGCLSSECITYKKLERPRYFPSWPKNCGCLLRQAWQGKTEYGDLYNWVIYEEANYGNGEFQCSALCKGETIQDWEGFFSPRQYIQSGECGCARSDVHPLGVDPPTKAFVPSLGVNWKYKENLEMVWSHVLPEGPVHVLRIGYHSQACSAGSGLWFIIVWRYVVQQ